MGTVHTITPPCQGVSAEEHAALLNYGGFPAKLESPREAQAADEIALGEFLVSRATVRSVTPTRFERVAALGDGEAAARTHLSAEFVKAFYTNPLTRIDTPGFASKTTALTDVVLDECFGTDSPMPDLLNIVGQVAAGRDQQVAAQALISKLAQRHADFHANDLAVDWAGQQ